MEVYNLVEPTVFKVLVSVKKDNFYYAYLSDRDLLFMNIYSSRLNGYRTGLTQLKFHGEEKHL